MVKISIFICITLITSSMAFSQTGAYFEGAKMHPSFQSAVSKYGTTSIEGKIIGYIDFAEGCKVGSNQTAGYQMTVEQGLKLAMTLVQAPSVLGLKKYVANVIITDHGLIIIGWAAGGQCQLFFRETCMIANHGARVFALSGK